MTGLFRDRHQEYPRIHGLCAGLGDHQRVDLYLVDIRKIIHERGDFGLSHP